MQSETRRPQQERSRRTLENLLGATAQMLEEHGLAGATVPRIAAAAGVATGSVYRRFEDKEALFRATFLDLIERTAEANRRNLRPEIFAGMTLEVATRALIRAIIRQFRTHPGLLTALEQFLESNSDVRFRKQATELIAGNYERISNVLLLFRKQIAHSDPKRAVKFAILSAITVIQVVTLAQTSMWQKVLPLNDEQAEAEMTRTVVAYLTSTPPKKIRGAKGKAVKALSLTRPSHA